jgi:DNA-binding IclR family transcriptional regulator
MAFTGELRTLQRGLQALVFLNKNGPTDISTLARKLELPRANMYRILKTMISDGYCTRIPNSRLYMVLPAVLSLSLGASQGELLTSVAIRVVEALAADVKWPIALSTPSGSDMLVRLATDKQSSLALGRSYPGYRPAMPMTSLGILYLALEKPEISAPILAMLRSGDGLARYDLNEAILRQLFDFARAHHYLIMETGWPEGRIGVPLMHRDRPIGGLVMRYIKSAVPYETLVTQFLPKLRDASAEILRLYRESLDKVSDAYGPLPAGLNDVIPAI